jgi:four helix bundle protein
MEGMEIVEQVYKLVRLFPNSEKFGLSSQITRSAVSIPSNIAEGSSRTSDKDFANFLGIALGSAYELETQIIIAGKLKYINETEINPVIKKLDLLQKKIFNLKNKIQQSK